MKFKAPGNEPVMVALLTGHTCTITPQGTDVEPRFRKEAIARGCVPMGVGAETPEAKPEPTKMDLICAGIERLLESEEEDSFTESGKPDARKLSDAVGFTVTALERDEAWEKVQATLSA